MRATEILEPIRAHLIPVPAVQPGICSVCRTATNDGYDECFVCASNIDIDVLPITMSIERSVMHHHLRNYKDGPDANARAVLGRRLAALVALFLANHDACIGPYDEVATVPSRRRNAPQHILDRVGSLQQYESGLLEMAGDGRLQVTRDVRDRSVLLFDDTFTTGRSIFAAVRTLRLSGANVMGPLVVGRHVNPTYNNSKPMVERLTGVLYDLTTCARCAGAMIIPPLRPNLLFDF